MAVPKATFVKLMALGAIPSDKNNIYMSRTPAWIPGGDATYGGHVYAQAVWAASKTVPRGLIVHNVHGYFTLPGQADRPFIYEVTPISDGRSYCTRSVTVRQPLSASKPPTPSTSQDSPAALDDFQLKDAHEPLGKICFSCICSFKRDSGTDGQPSHQEVKNIKEEYAVALEEKKPWDHEVAPHADSPWYYDLVKTYPQPDNFPGLYIRKADMSAYNASKPPSSYRQLSFYRTLGIIPASEPNLHACAHLYACDRNSLFLISYVQGMKEMVTKMGSLSISVVFHVDGQDMFLADEEALEGDEGIWYCQEAWSTRSQGGRGMHESKIWDARGLHVASTWQEGLVRTRLDDSEPRKRGFTVSKL